MDNSTQQLIFNILTLLLAAGAIIASIWVYFRQKSEKKFGYRIVTLIPILNINRNFKDRLQVIFDQKPVTEPYLIAIQFICSGQKEIIPTDHHRPIKVSFNGEAKILSAEVSEAVPPNPEAQLDVGDNFATLRPLLLNSRDTVTVTIVLDSRVDSDKVMIDGQLVGVSRLENLSLSIQQSDFRSKAILAVITFGIVITIVLWAMWTQQLSVWIALWAGYLMFPALRAALTRLIIRNSS